MKKSSNFKLLFEKIHKDNLFRSSYYRKELKQERLSKRNSINSNININLSNCKQKQKKFKQVKVNQRSKSARPPSYRVPIPVQKQLSSQSMKQFCQFIQITQKQIRKFLQNKTDLQIINIKNQLKIIKNLCQSLKEITEQSQKIFESFSLDLSKLLDHRITRIVFYFIYAKFLECTSLNNLTKQIKLLLFCNQYSRSLNILIISLHSCSRIQKILLEEKKFQQSKQYAKKTLKLAIYLKNTSEQFKAIEALKLLSFYNGAIYSCKQNYLKKDERQRIYKNYHPIYDENLDKQPLQHRLMKQIALQIEEINQQEQDKRISKNIEGFISNLSVINKDLTDRSKNIMKTIQKMNKFGLVNKYLDRGNYITLQPYSRNLPNKNRQQVFLTHTRKNSQIQTSKKFHKFYLPKFIQMISALISNS